ncbi:hypothetical protein [Bdellovibrio sp. HCB337]|uniref:hypothetical protein n=1 Tax=Bdellovibrio sp. HCB337 TaxID=3394358 RepID=UPI0039A78206
MISPKHFLSFIFTMTSISQAFAANDCKNQSVSFEKDGFKVRTLKYESVDPSSKYILVMPPTGGTNYLDRSYAETLCEKGFNVFVVEGWTGDQEFSWELDIHRRFYTRSQDAIDLVTKNIQGSFIGILGTSVGAIHAAIAVQHHDRIQAAFLITGGAPISEVIANSDQEILLKMRRQRFTAMGFKSQNDYVQAIDQVLPMDPFNSSPIAPTKKLAMVIAPEDTTVPADTQKSLRDLWRPQWTLEMSGSHKSVIIKTWLLHRNKVVDFFKNATL